MGRQATAAPEKEIKCEEAGEREEMKGKIRCYCSQRWGDRSVLLAPPAPSPSPQPNPLPQPVLSAVRVSA